jgi:formylglycine-generating enzyme required for sulfatase activity
MVLIPAGTFLMGSEGWGEFEGPIHEVFLNEFWMDETLVTNSQFRRFAQETRYQTEAERIGAAWGFRHGQFSSKMGSAGRATRPQAVTTTPWC